MRRTLMNRSLWIVVSLVVVASMGIAQQRETTFKERRPYFSSNHTPHPAKALEGYVRNLNSTNNGVVESSIAHVAFMVMTFPDIDRSATMERLEKLSMNGSTPEIRYKAYLANLVAGDPDTFRGVLTTSCSDADQFFLAISQRAQASLLARDSSR
jgi:hypothetical protein